MSATIKYKGNTIATIDTNATKTLKTSGKYCEGDIVVEYVKSGVSLPTLSNPGTAGDLISGKELIDGSGNKITGTIPVKTTDDLTVDHSTVNVPSGYYATGVAKAVKTTSQAKPTITKSISNHIATLTPTVTNEEGYIGGGTVTGDARIVTPAELVSGTLTITENGTRDCSMYKNVTVNVSGSGSITTVALTITPTVAMPPKTVYYTTGSGTVGQYTSTSTAPFTLDVALNTAIAVYNVATMKGVSILGGSDSYLNDKITGVMFVTSAQSINIGS